MEDYRANTKVRHKIYALYKCLYHWEYMAISVSDDKDDFFSMQKNLSYYRPSFECFCCDSAQVEYNGVKWGFGFGSRDCTKCPLGGYTWEYAAYGQDTICNAYDEDNKEPIHEIPFSSLFDYWCEGNEEERKRMASRMVRVIKEAISDMESERLRRR